VDVLGDSVGDKYRGEEGSIDGLDNGLILGFTDGKPFRLGSIDGIIEGNIDGFVLGDCVGFKLGNNDG